MLLPRSLLLALTLALVLWGVTPRPLAAETRQDAIGPRDTLSIRVYEWRTSSGEPFEWKALTGDFIVSGNGQLSLPVIGAITVAGLFPEQAAALVAQRLQQTTGLRNLPTASVQITTYRPFYIVGGVDKPGEYPFRPDLTVLQAISIAGGLRRNPENLFSRFERDAITSRGDMRVHGAHINALIAAQARLRAELDGAERIVFPADLTRRRDEPEILRMLEEEELIFRSRNDSIRQRTASNERLRTLLMEQIRSLRNQSTLKEQQIASARREFEEARRLGDRGLVTAPRQLALERSVADYEAGLFEIQRSIVDAQVRIAEAERLIVDLKGRQRDEAALELRVNQTRLAETREKFETARRLVQEAEVTAPLELARAHRARRGTGPVYSIVRRVGGEMQEFEASEAMPVLPGDTVRVTVPLPEVSLDPALDLAPGQSERQVRARGPRGASAVPTD